MTKNEIVVRWVMPPRNSNAEMDYNLLHKAWIKFRDLNHPYSDTDNYRKWDWYRTVIANTITHGTIAEAFAELVEGIEWYNLINKTN